MEALWKATPENARIDVPVPGARLFTPPQQPGPAAPTSGEALTFTSGDEDRTALGPSFPPKLLLFDGAGCRRGATPGGARAPVAAAAPGAGPSRRHHQRQGAPAPAFPPARGNHRSQRALRAAGFHACGGIGGSGANRGCRPCPPAPPPRPRRGEPLKKFSGARGSLLPGRAGLARPGGRSRSRGGEAGLGRERGFGCPRRRRGRRGAGPSRARVPAAGAAPGPGPMGRAGARVTWAGRRAGSPVPPQRSRCSPAGVGVVSSLSRSRWSDNAKLSCSTCVTWCKSVPIDVCIFPPQGCPYPRARPGTTEGARAALPRASAAIASVTKSVTRGCA